MRWLDRGAVLLVFLVAGSGCGQQRQATPVPGPSTSSAPTPAKQPESPRAAAPAPAEIQPTSAPAMAFSMDEFLRFTAEYQKTIGAALDIDNPPAKTNTTIAVRLQNGVVVRGVVAGLTAGTVTIRRETDTKEVHMSDLSVDERLACDASYRTNWISLGARVRARFEYEDLGCLFPDAPSNDVETALSLADPVALYDRGRMYLDGTPAERDVPVGFMYIRLAAMGHHTQAAYTLGRLYYSGTGVAKNESEAVRWLSMAADSGYEPARKFLDNLASSHAAVAAALREHRDKAEQEKLAYAARVESARTNAATTLVLQRNGFQTLSGVPIHRPYDAWWNGSYWVYRTDSGMTVFYDQYGRKHVISGHR